MTRADLRRLIAGIHVLQLDSVSVAVRAHYAPVFSRLGPYDRDVLDRAAWSHTTRSPRLLVEYWAHEAALMAVEDWPLLRWRMREYVRGRWGVEIVKAHPGLVEAVIAAVDELGPSTAGRIEAHLQSGGRRGKGAWWNRSETKWVAEALFASGVLTTAPDRFRPALRPRRTRSATGCCGSGARRRGSGARTHPAGGGRAGGRHRTGSSRLLPAAARSVQARGRGTGGGGGTRAGRGGWVERTGLSARRAAGPRADRGTALLCPFDPLIFFRPRVQRIFDFEYRIEIYTPAAKRRFGYYVWPFLLDGDTVGRVDLKADRRAGALLVPGAFIEPRAGSGRGSPVHWLNSWPRWRLGWGSTGWRSGSAAIWRRR